MEDYHTVHRRWQVYVKEVDRYSVDGIERDTHLTLFKMCTASSSGGTAAETWP